MKVISAHYWLPSAMRICRTAFRMRDRFGDRALFIALQRYQVSIRLGGFRQRSFWRSLCQEIMDQLRRRDFLQKALREAAYAGKLPDNPQRAGSAEI